MLGVDVSHSSKQASQKVQSAYRKYLIDGATKGFNISQEVVPQDRGTLLQSGFPPEVDSKGNVIWGYSGPSYIRPMEEGTDPFQPPVKPLVEWAERVAGDPGLGYYVALEKIPKEGIEGHGFVAEGREAQKQWYQSNDFGDYLDRRL